MHGPGALPFPNLDSKVFDVRTLREIVDAAHPLDLAYSGTAFVFPYEGAPEFEAVTLFSSCEGFTSGMDGVIKEATRDPPPPHELGDLDKLLRREAVDPRAHQALPVQRLLRLLS